MKLIDTTAHWWREHYISVAIDVGVICSLWALLAIEVHLLPIVSIAVTQETADGINRILLGLSYSYLAGWIIYLLTVSLPEYNKRRKLSPIIRRQIDSIANQLHNLVMEFCLPPNQNPDIFNVSQCIQTMKARDWTDPVQMPFKPNGTTLKQSFIHDFTNLCNMIDDTLECYTLYLTTDQCLLLESMRHTNIPLVFTFERPPYPGFDRRNIDLHILPDFEKVLMNFQKLKRSL